MSVQEGRGSAFGERLRRYRRAAGLTQEELAAKSGLSVRAVADIERGRTTRPYRRSVGLLADALGLSGQDEDLFARASRTGAGAGTLMHSRVVPRQLPAAVRHFAGREAELGLLSAQLDQVTAGRQTVVISAIAGTAGIGKTALAVYWGHQVAHMFPDGQLYVNLRGFDPSGMPVRPATAVRGFLDALHVAPADVPADLDAQVGLYRSLLAGRTMLVVLDNARDADQVRPLLPGARGNLAVVTSRSQLTGLVATEDAYPISLDVLTTTEALDLLAGRLGTDRLSDENEAAVEIARVCSGLPLAVSVAAARAACRPEVALASLARELKDSRNLLDALSTGDMSTSPRAVFSWSYRLLSTEAARLFRLLGLHPGPDICAEAAGSLAGVQADTARELLSELTRAHLVAAPASGRFGFHDLLRAYAGDCAREQEQEADRAEAIRRVLGWYLHTAVAAARVLDPHRRHVSLDRPAAMCEPLSFDSYDHALRWLEAERPNLVAAVTCAGRHGAHDIAWKLPIALWDLFNLTGYSTDWIESVHTGLASARHVQDDAAQAWLLNHLAMAYQQSGNSAMAIGCFGQALAIRKATGDRHGVATVLANLGRTYSEAGQLAESMECLQEALSVFRETSQKSAQGKCLTVISATCRRQGRLDEAVTSARQAVDIIKETGDRREESGALTQLALASLCLRRLDDAIKHSLKAVELGRVTGDRRAEAEALEVLAQAMQDGGQAAQARQHWYEAYLILEDLADPRAAQILCLLEPC